MRRTALLTALLAFGCDGATRNTGGGGGGGGTTRADATTTDALAMDAGDPDAGMMMGMIPDPGTQPANEWPDVEPNDTPETATPVGRLEYAFWMGFSQPYNTISSNTDVDFYVFRTGDAMSLQNLLLQVCWSPAMGGQRLNLLDLYVYPVVNGQKGAAVLSENTTNDSCETFDSATAAMALAADSVYLLEVRPGPGLDLGTHTGLYSA